MLLSIGPQHSFPLEQLFKMLGPHNGQEMLQQALFAVPVFPLRWRWNVSRALVVLRFQNGKKVPFFLQRFRADDLLAATFPATVGCLENHHGDIDIPDHPLVRQALDDCLHEAMDIVGLEALLTDVAAGNKQLVARDLGEPPTVLGQHQLLQAVHGVLGRVGHRVAGSQRIRRRCVHRITEIAVRLDRHRAVAAGQRTSDEASDHPR